MSEQVTAYTDLVPAIRAIYAEHAAGCCFHVVLDDSNFQSDFVKSCSEYALGCNLCRPLACLMSLPGATMTKLSKATRAVHREIYDERQRRV